MNFEYDDLVMNDKELGECVNEHVATINVEEVSRMVDFICAEAIENGNLDELRALSPYAGILYISGEMYKYGFFMALYLMNESFKEFFSKEGGPVA